MSQLTGGAGPEVDAPTSDPPGRAGSAPLARLVIALFRAWQVLRAGRPSPCRFVPTCSTFAIEAIEVHGPVRGAWLALRRLGRCRPFGPYGFDPVPLRPTSGSPPTDLTAA